MPSRPPVHRPHGNTGGGPPVSRRLSAHRRGYTRQWSEYARAFLALNPLCVACEREGRVEAATQVDHKRAVRGPDDPGFWDASNHQGLCHHHHSVKTATVDGGFGR